MRAVMIGTVTPAEEITLTEVSVPEVKPGWVLVRVKAFGLNHSEQILRQEEIEAPYIQKPVIPGIECVGEVADPGDTRFGKGQKVCALMGGMGWSFHGSYAEYALLPEHHVFAMNTSLSWEEAGAVPETYFTAWGSLFECLHLKADDTLLVRGGTCALGYASIQIAKALGCKVIATTHREAKLPLLSAAGADKCVLDDGTLTGFFSNYPTQKIMDEIFTFLDHHRLTPCRGPVFDFENIRGALLAQDNKTADGKIVVRV